MHIYIHIYMNVGAFSVQTAGIRSKKVDFDSYKTAGIYVYIHIYIYIHVII